MIKMMRSFFALAAAFTVFMADGANAATVTVDSQAGPWLQSLNSGFSYGNSAGFDNGPPTTVSVTSGDLVTIQYVSGTTSPVSGVNVDANGTAPFDPSVPEESAGRFPGFYTADPAHTYLAELMGTFANNGVMVGTPFAIGDASLTLAAPAGANELLLGINDNVYADNTGSLQVSVTEVASAVPETSTWAMMLLGFLGVGFLAFRRRDQLSLAS